VYILTLEKSSASHTALAEDPIDLVRVYLKQSLHWLRVPYHSPNILRAITLVDDL
jgi:hypothetical protein